MNKLLDGVCVVEHTSFISGPCAGMLLADLGARVIKIERPVTGEPFRSFSADPCNSHFQSYNRNKESIALDPTVDADRTVLDGLIKKADVFLHNFRPGTPEKLFIGQERLRQLNPRLIYCSVNGFGSDGPASSRPAYDTVAQAVSGFLHLVTHPENPRVVGPAVADSVTGLYGAYGILGALFRRSVTGQGMSIEVSMLEAMCHFNIDAFSDLFKTGLLSDPFTRARGSQSYILCCSDKKYVSLHLSSPAKFWEALAETIGQPTLLQDPRFCSRELRMSNQEQLIPILQDAFGRDTRDNWCAKLAAVDVPHAPVYDVREACTDPQFLHLGIQVPSLGSEEAALSAIRCPLKIDGVHSTSVRAAPQLDADRKSVLRFLEAH